MTRRIRRVGSLVVFASVALAACGKPPSAPAGSPQTSAAAAASAAPADPQLAKLYAQTCKACHTNPATGAPQAGDAQAWGPRMQQGLPVLVQHAINGYKGMPPMGSCMDCSEAEFEALIKFMSSGR